MQSWSLEQCIGVRTQTQMKLFLVLNDGRFDSVDIPADWSKRRVARVTLTSLNATFCGVNVNGDRKQVCLSVCYLGNSRTL